LAAGERLSFAEQDEAGATYAEKIAASDRLLDPAMPALALERVVRALHPHVGARLERADGQLLGVLRARALAEEASLSPGRLSGREGRLLYGTAAGALELIEVRPPGGRPMSGADYLRGHAC
jgi:methionyl-tRNA formyltransferase